MSTHRLGPGAPLRLLAAALLLVFALPASSSAGKWKMAKEAKPIYYKVQSTMHDRRGERRVVIEVDISAVEQTDDKGQPMYRVRTTQEQVVPARDLKGGQMAFGAAASGWAGMAAMQWFAYQPLLGQLELAVGEKMSYFGGMLATVTGKETIAGYEGFVVELFNTTKDEPELIADFVLHPDVPIALRSRSYRKGEVQHENLLLKHEAR